ncbi:MAG: hypothetical protein V1753_10690, partial [Pseudomonadota bacterium]
TSSNRAISFLINAGTSFYRKDDTFEFTVTLAGSWLVRGSVSGLQSGSATTDEYYTSDSDQVGFLIAEGGIAFTPGDYFTFNVISSGLGHGTTVNEIVKVPGTHGATAVLYAATSSGVYRSEDGGIVWAETETFIGDSVNCLVLHPTSNGTTDIIYAGTEQAGVWASSDSGDTWTPYVSGLGEGISSSTPFPNSNNTGNGSIGAVTVGKNTLSENWTVTCTSAATNSGTFGVTGSVSGVQTNTATVGAVYTSNGGEVSFTILDGTDDFVVGDTFAFKTTRDPGMTIVDLMIDSTNNRLYNLTYFWGELEPHAVGNVYAIALNSGSGYMPTGSWSETNTGLPQYDPPDDSTVFAQHVMAANRATSPTAFYIGGQGINLYKATSGITTGAPLWLESKVGITNLIMARLPILFTGVCDLDVTSFRAGNTIRYRIYVQDTNGNPPIAGSTLTVTAGDSELLNITYPDAKVYQGTWRDPSDPSTNNPFEPGFTLADDDEDIEVEIAFTTPTGTDVPGSSGLNETQTFGPYNPE